MGMISVKARAEELGLDISNLESGILEQVEMAVGGIARAAKNHWVSLAQDRLHTSRETYVQGLRQAESFNRKTVSGTSVYEIALVGRMPNNHEFGMASFDMKAVRPGWLGGGKARTAKDGHKFIIIPFSHSTSDGPRQNYTGKAAGVMTSDGDLKKHLRASVKKYGLDRMMRAASGRVVEGPVAKIPTKAPSVHPYLQGMVRIQKGKSGFTKAGQRGESQLKTFRIMSENSDPGSWHHPGLNAANLLPEVEKYVESQLDNVMNMIAASLL